MHLEHLPPAMKRAFPLEGGPLPTEPPALPRPPADKIWLDTDLSQREMLRCIPVAVYSCDRDGIITYCNQAAALLWGRWLEIGKDPWYGEWKIFRPDGSAMPVGECPMAAILRGGALVPGEQVILQRADGTHRYVEPHPECIHDAAGQVAGAVVTIVDLTDSDAGRTALRTLHARQNVRA